MVKNNTPFKKGEDKANGRKPGSKNRTTAEIREFIQSVVNNIMDTLQHDLDALKLPVSFID